jgi:hypothetical protein
MAESPEIYLARADAAASEARLAVLENVRDRALRAEAAWRGMAERLLTMQANRVVADRERAERKEAEAQLQGLAAELQ